MRTLAVVICALCLSGCGRYADTLQRLRSGGTTNVTFLPPRVQNQRGDVVSLATLVGGVMVYAVNAGEPFRRGGKKLLDETDGTAWTIPTASYIFYGIGYDGVNLGGTMHCGQTPPVPLNGTSMTIQLVLDQNNCGNPPFTAAGYASGNQPQPLRVATCPTAANPTIGSSCGSGSGFSTVTVSLPEYNAFDGSVAVVEGNGGSNNLESSCSPPISVGGPVSTLAKIPTGVGVPGDAFVVGFNAYDVSTCSGWTNKELFGFARSIFNFNDPSFRRFELNGAPVFPSGNPVKFGTDGTSMFVYLNDF